LSFLADHFFLQFWVPLITVSLTIFLKFVSRRDTHRSFAKEDLAFGLDLAAVALFFFLTYGSRLARELVQTPDNKALLAKAMSLPWILFAYVVGLWAISTLVRKAGWESEGKLTPIVGIFIPDVFGVACLIFAVNWVP
jgi:hypothetical protein